MPVASSTIRSAPAPSNAISGRTSGASPATKASTRIDDVDGADACAHRNSNSDSRAIQKMTRQVSSPDVAKSRAGTSAM